MLGPVLTSQKYKYVKFYVFIQKLNTGAMPAPAGYSSAYFSIRIKTIPS